MSPAPDGPADNTTPGTSGGSTDGDRPVFDPRHDAIYQRGYRPGDGRPAPEAVPEKRRTAARRPVVPPTTPHAPAAQVAATPPAQVESDPFPAAPAHEVDALLADLLTVEQEPSRGRNPFIGALWIVAVFLVAAALTLQWQAVLGYAAPYSYSGSGPLPMGMIIQQLSYAVTPSVLTAGLLTIAGLLFWHATNWRARRHPHQ